MTKTVLFDLSDPTSPLLDNRIHRYKKHLDPYDHISLFCLKYPPLSQESRQILRDEQGDCMNSFKNFKKIIKFMKLF